MDNLDLTSAKRYYNHLVPWDIDDDDLKVINKIRKQVNDDTDVRIVRKMISDKLWDNATKVY